MSPLRSTTRSTHSDAVPAAPRAHLFAQRAANRGVACVRAATSIDVIDTALAQEGRPPGTSAAVINKRYCFASTSSTTRARGRSGKSAVTRGVRSQRRAA